jgi:hypothetical protein
VWVKGNLKPELRIPSHELKTQLQQMLLSPCCLFVKQPEKVGKMRFKLGTKGKMTIYGVV